MAKDRDDERRGGEKTADTHDKDFYKKIGKKGGKA